MPLPSPGKMRSRNALMTPPSSGFRTAPGLLSSRSYCPKDSLTGGGGVINLHLKDKDPEAHTLESDLL